MNITKVQVVGFVGLGDQGGPMAVAIADAGFALHAWARRPQSYEALAGTVFQKHGNLASLAKSVDLLALCLRDDEDINDLIAENDLLKATRPGTIVVNHGTGDPKVNNRFCETFAAQDVQFLDAPVSGGRSGAIARTLTTMVGGDRISFDRSNPVFDCFSQKVALMGPAGAGQLAKLLNNALTMTNLKNAAEVFDVAHQLGIDLRILKDVIAVSSGSSTILQAVGAQIDTEIAGHLQALMRKDIEHFADAVRDRGLDPTEIHSWGIAGAEELVRFAGRLQPA